LKIVLWSTILHIIIEDGRHAGTQGLIDDLEDLHHIVVNLFTHFLVTHEHHLVWRIGVKNPVWIMSASQIIEVLV
jgi:hypothetical protein